MSSIAVIPEASFPEIFLSGDPLRQRGESYGSPPDPHGAPLSIEMWWAWQDSNLRQHRYERWVLTAELQARTGYSRKYCLTKDVAADALHDSA